MMDVATISHITECDAAYRKVRFPSRPKHGHHGDIENKTAIIGNPVHYTSLKPTGARASRRNPLCKRAIGKFALSLAATLLIGGAYAAEKTPQGNTWDSIKRLPDWSGVWGLDDASFAKVVAASSAPDGNPNIPPLTVKYAALRRENGAANGGRGPDGKGVVTNSVNCIPDGMPGVMIAPFAFEFLFTPGRVTIIPEDNEVRRIYTDGRPHPDDPDPTFMGHSIGHWEGKTLVVDTVGMLAQAQLLVGLHVTEKTHVVERIFRKDADTMQIDTTVTDPDMFTRPDHYTRTYKASKAGMVEYYCTQNNRDTNLDVNLSPPTN